MGRVSLTPGAWAVLEREACIGGDRGVSGMLLGEVRGQTWVVGDVANDAARLGADLPAPDLGHGGEEARLWRAGYREAARRLTGLRPLGWWLHLPSLEAVVLSDLVEQEGSMELCGDWAADREVFAGRPQLRLFSTLVTERLWFAGLLTRQPGDGVSVEVLRPRGAVPGR